MFGIFGLFACRLALLALALVLIPYGLLAQKANIGERTTGLTIPTTKPATNNPSESGNSSVAVGMYLDGKVAVAGGGEVPLNVVIEKMCGARRSALGYADRKGNFSVRVSGNNLASLVDASDDSRASLGAAPSTSRQQGGANLMGCEIHAVYAGYRSASIEVGSQRVMDNPNVGTILIRRTSTGSGTMVSATLLSAPKSAVKAYDHGMDLLRKGNLEAAIKDFEKAVALHPAFANAWFELGHLGMTGNAARARADLEKAVAADGRFVPPYTDLAVLAFREKNWEETVRITDRGLHLDSSGSPELYYYSAAAHFNLRNLDEAEKKARGAIRVDYGHSLPRAPQLLSYVLGSKGDFSGAAEQMRAYLATGLDAEEDSRSRKQLAAMESKIK